MAGRAQPLREGTGMTNVTTRRRALASSALLVACLAVFAGCGNSSSSSSATNTSASDGATAVQNQFVDVVGQVSPQVVQILTNAGLGSGIVDNSNGDIVTNAHVVGNSPSFVVTLPGGTNHDATLVGTDPSNDLAVIHLTGATPSPATFGDSAGVRSGDIVWRREQELDDATG
jgi:putative serine protease PepD